ncbi:CBS domain-containing protein [Acidicapsa acidisoli]|uniref:hypothetical protein n=1 Tax=Acidicapsa acidisoli TaxID=1615681 RepID=UPI0021DFCE86|nr:hypothetical protein [Acidicapsa acidisoli]
MPWVSLSRPGFPNSTAADPRIYADQLRYAATLRADGNGYIQGVISRSFQVAKPEDTLGAIIRRITAGRGLRLIPVAEGERIVGMVSVQNLRATCPCSPSSAKSNAWNPETSFG